MTSRTKTRRQRPVPSSKASVSFKELGPDEPLETTVAFDELGKELDTHVTLAQEASEKAYWEGVLDLALAHEAERAAQWPAQEPDQ